MEFQGIVVTIVDTGRAGIQVEATAPTIEEAVQKALNDYEAIQPILPLMWADGRPVEGYARQVLVEALETYAQYLGQTPPAEVALMIGRLKASLGEAS